MDGIYYDAYFKVTKWEGEPKINEPDKIEEIKWCNVDELPENLIDIRKNGIKNYLEIFTIAKLHNKIILYT